MSSPRWKSQLPPRSGLQECLLSGDQVSPPPSCRKADVRKVSQESGPLTQLAPPLRPSLTPPPPTLCPPHPRGAGRAAGFAPANVDPVDSVDPVFQFTPARDSR